MMRLILCGWLLVATTWVEAIGLDIPICPRCNVQGEFIETSLPTDLVLKGYWRCPVCKDSLYPLKSLERIEKKLPAVIMIYSFTHFIGLNPGNNSEHSWTTDTMPEIKIDYKKKAIWEARDKEETERQANYEKWEKDHPEEMSYHNPYEKGWIYTDCDRTITYIDCPICGGKVYIKMEK